MEKEGPPIAWHAPTGRVVRGCDGKFVSLIIWETFGVRFWTLSWPLSEFAINMKHHGRGGTSQSLARTDGPGGVRIRGGARNFDHSVIVQGALLGPLVVIFGICYQNETQWKR